jgi:hypothetical protein
LKKFGIVTPHRNLNMAENMAEAHIAAVVDIGNIDLIRKGEITVISQEIGWFSNDSVTFKNGEKIQFDAVIFCTGKLIFFSKSYFLGYQKTATFSKFLNKNIVNECLNNRGVIRGCSMPKYNLFFNGYNNNTGRFKQMKFDAVKIGNCIESFLNKKLFK